MEVGRALETRPKITSILRRSDNERQPGEPQKSHYRHTSPRLFNHSLQFPAAISSHAFRAITQNGKSLFIKTHPHPPPQFFEAESLGLAMLQKTKSLAVPAIHAVISEPELEALILEWVEPGPMHSHTSEEFGRGLAMLHRSQAPYFGLDHRQLHIGTLKQPNSVSQELDRVFDRYRIRPQIRLAQFNGFSRIGSLRSGSSSPASSRAR